MRIEVTQHDIDEGCPEDSYRCPVSRAIRRAVGIPTSVTGASVLVDYGTPWQTHVWAPEKVVEFVDAFDADEEVEPFAFDLDFDPTRHAQLRGDRS